MERMLLAVINDLTLDEIKRLQNESEAWRSLMRFMKNEEKECSAFKNKIKNQEEEYLDEHEFLEDLIDGFERQKKALEQALQKYDFLESKIGFGNLINT